MIVSKNWLQKYFDAPLPDAGKIADALTFHAFEIDSVEERASEKNSDAIIDVKVLPNRAADCLSHRGIAKEIGAILQLPMKPDVLRKAPETFPQTDALAVSVEDARACPRYMGAVVKGVKVGPSPAWLREALEAVGQRSINNIVDATNYVMFDLGQPMHAFDAARLTADANGARAIAVRGAKDGETMVTLSGDEFVLQKGILVITDAHADAAIGIAGIKGGKAAEITEATTDIIIEAANFDAVMVRRAMQSLKLYTDAGKRFQNNISPELASHAMSAVLAIIKDIAGGELIGVTDFYPAPQETVQVPITAARVNALLGTQYQSGDLAQVFDRLGLAYKRTVEDFTVDPPFERRDISIPEDLVEEVGRIMGYENIPPMELPSLAEPADQARFRGIERMKDSLIAEGFTEVSTQSFATKGDIKLMNPLDTAKPWLRTSLEENLKESLAKAKLDAPLFLKPNAKPKLFEIGTVFPQEGEFVELRMTEGVPAWGKDAPTHDNLTVAKLEDYGKDYEPKKVSLGAYQPQSAYPFIARDIALWAPLDAKEEDVKAIIAGNASSPAHFALFVRVEPFDRFEKEGRVSLAFRIVFQSFERTLTDEEANAIMANISAALAAKGYEVR